MWAAKLFERSFWGKEIKNDIEKSVLILLIERGNDEIIKILLSNPNLDVNDKV